MVGLTAAALCRTMTLTASDDAGPAKMEDSPTVLLSLRPYLNINSCFCIINHGRGP